MNPACHETHLLQQSILPRLSFTPRDFTPSGPDYFHVVRRSISLQRTQADLLPLPALSKPGCVIRLFGSCAWGRLPRCPTRPCPPTEFTSSTLDQWGLEGLGGSEGVRPWVVDVPTGHPQLPLHPATLSLKCSGSQPAMGRA
jgi:hypothetical protein